MVVLVGTEGSCVLDSLVEQSMPYSDQDRLHGAIQGRRDCSIDLDCAAFIVQVVLVLRQYALRIQRCDLQDDAQNAKMLRCLCISMNVWFCGCVCRP